MKENNSTNPAGQPSAQGEYLVSMQEQVVAVLRALNKGTGNVFTKAQAQKALDWAHKTRVEQALLQVVLRGRVAIRFRGEELEFVAVEFLN